jgi:DNA (cytosine-5)-methyltransferase 1
MAKLKILDLFAGVGGLSLGLELVKDKKGNHPFELYRAVEIDQYACETLRNRYGADKVIEGDITKLNIANKIINDCKGKVSIIIGGIPCQSFSLLGPRSGFGKKMEKFKKDMRDNLYEHFRDIVGEIKPNIIIIENVKGILSKKDSNGELIIKKILSDFEALGYNFENSKGNKFNIINAANQGVPQKRERVILIGIKKEWKNVNVPLIKSTHFDPTSENAEELIQKGLLPHVTLSEAIGDLPKVEPKITMTGLGEHEIKKIKRENEHRYNGKDELVITEASFKRHHDKLSSSGKEFFKHIKPNNHLTITHHVARAQQLSDIKLFSLMKEGETAGEFFDRCPEKARQLIKYDMNSFLDKYRKQSKSNVSTTVFAHLEKDGNRFIHPEQNRTITPREAARIQSFPDDFVFMGPLNKKFKQIGNAVPPLLSKAIGVSLLEIL